MYQKILVATDLTPGSEPALRTAVELAGRLGASLAVVTVVHALDEQANWFLPDSPAVQAVRDAIASEEDTLRGRLSAALSGAGGDPATATLVVAHGNPADQIVAAGNQFGADLIVTGTHGRRGFQHAIMGSVAERVVRTAAHAVLVVRSA